MMINEIELNRITENLWEIPLTGNMRVPGRIYISEEMISKNLKTDDALKQVINVAHLPGIEKYSLAMPDIHWGYGFPIGGVAATNLNDGVISPGGVGYDINCGVRLIVTNLQTQTVKKRIEHLVSKLFEYVPTGVGASGAIKKLSRKDLKKVLEIGSVWAAEHDMAIQSDIEFTEESGTLKNADPDIVSERALERGANQVGTLGSGNHFLEVDVVEEISARVLKEERKNAQMEKKIQGNKDKANFFANKGCRMRLLAKRMREEAVELEENKIDVRQEDKTIRSFRIPVQEDIGGTIFSLSSFSILKNHKVVKKKAKIDLSKNMHLLLTGPNGIGKTTLLEFIRRIFFGFPRLSSNEKIAEGT
ncbi:MAG: RtcB family protein [Bacteroidetes bacterium]|nr:RtcB family protein [Bacteroidota bacterium]